MRSAYRSPWPLNPAEVSSNGVRALRVETCLPMKVLAGQAEDLYKRGIRTLFHPSMVIESSIIPDGSNVTHCPYIQASLELLSGRPDLEWKELVINSAVDPDSFAKEHARLAMELGFSADHAKEAQAKGMEALGKFRSHLRRQGEAFLNSLAYGEKAVVVLGKPYHTADRFLNMNMAGLFRRLGVKAMPSDLYPIEPEQVEQVVTWKYQNDLILAARAISREDALYPIMITFFGCGPDPFIVRHLKEAVGDKPLLILEMDEHSSRAGVMTRIEAFLDQARRRGHRPKTPQALETATCEPPAPGLFTLEHASRLFDYARTITPDSLPSRQELVRAMADRFSPRAKVDRVLLPFLGDNSYAFAAAARAMGIETHVLPPPDGNSLRLGLGQAVGGECLPYVLVLGDYLRHAQSLRGDTNPRTRFYMLEGDICRLSQWPVYMEMIRRKLGLTMGVIVDRPQLLADLGLNQFDFQRAMLKAYEALTAYEVHAQVYYRIRPFAADRGTLRWAYEEGRNRLFEGISQGRARQGIDEALHLLHSVRIEEKAPRPVIAVTGDYYTRAVPYANNDVLDQLESLGAILWPQVTFSDYFKLQALRDSVWRMKNGQALSGARHGIRLHAHGCRGVQRKELDGVQTGHLRTQRPVRDESVEYSVCERPSYAASGHNSASYVVS